MAKNKKTIFILLAIVMVVIITAVTTFIMMSFQGKEKEPAPEKPLVRENYPLGEFIANVTHERGYRFIRADITLLIGDKKVIPRLDQEKAQIRDAIIKILRKSGRELIDDPDGWGLREQIKESIDLIVGSTVVEDVYFTDFVIQ